MNKKKLIFVISIIFAVFVIVVNFLAIKLSKLSESNYSTEKKIEKEFYERFDEISYIAMTLEDTPYSIISIQDVDYIYDEGDFGTWYIRDDKTGIEGSEEISDAKLVEMLNKIFNERKYQAISKKGKTIYFQLWATLDAGRGVAYVSDGKTPVIEFLTKYRKLDKENWFYYETDFNEWKSQ